MPSALFPTPLEVGVEEALAARPFPAACPFASSSPSLFAREDDSPDAESYGAVMPRFTRPYDEAAMFALTLYLGEVLAEYTDGSASRGVDVLDVAAGWVSHLPDDIPFGRVVGVGLNAYELERNGRLDERIVLDLNGAAAEGDGPGGGAGACGGVPLPLEADSVDVVTLTAALEVLTRPLEVLAECLRVTRPGGSVVVSFSSKPGSSSPPGKVTRLWGLWGRGEGGEEVRTDAERAWAVAALLHYAGWGEIEAWDLSPSRSTDPLFVVRGRKGG